MKKGFTLAEVLVTLAIIGIVAALTIPALMFKYNQHVLYTQFTKSFNTISNMLQLSVAQNGNPDTWSYEYSKLGDVTKNYIYPYLKIASECMKENAAECNLSYEYKYINGVGGGIFSDDFGGGTLNNAPIVTLQDGTVLSVGYWSTMNGRGEVYLSRIVFNFDINGPKGPNVLGRDIFILGYSGSPRSKWTWSIDSAAAKMNCNPGNHNASATGEVCAQRLILERKMDY